MDKYLLESNVATYFFDGAGGISDPSGNWTNDANAFDGSTATTASNAVASTAASGFLQGNGTTTPSSGGTITRVRARVYGTQLLTTERATIYTGGLAESLGESTASNLWGSYVTLTTPSGGWTWAKLQALEVKLHGTVGFEASTSVARVEIEVTATNTADGYLLEDGTGVYLIDYFAEQTAFRLYEDGTETGSTAIAAQNTNITRDVTANSNLQLRTRLQNTTATAGNATDDYQLQYSTNSGEYYNVSGVANQTGVEYYFDGSDVAVSDPNNVWTNESNLTDSSKTTFATTSTNGSVSSNYLKIEGTNAPSSGISINSVEIGINVSSGFGGHVSISAPTGGWTYAKLQALEVRLWSIDDTFGGEDYFVSVFTDGEAETLLSGALVSADSNTGGPSQVVLVINRTVRNFFSASIINGNATTNRLGAGTGSFVAGEISENGEATDHQITASNFTEYLYSLTLVSSALANNDTLDFRLLRNGQAVVRYVVTPRITASKGGGAAGQKKIHNGTAWISKPVKIHNGTAWVTKPLKIHNGTAWVVTNN